MTELPLTRNRLSPERESEIRDAVRVATGIPFSEAPSRLAQLDDADAFLDFLSAPEIHGPIYNLPKPLTRDSVARFISGKLAARQRGDGLLFLRFDPQGQVIGYSEFDLWPEWGAGDLGGALRVDKQGQRAGVNGARRSFTWMFNALRLELIVATGALDNIRTARMLDGLGLERRGEIVSQRPDGTSRASRVWEVTRDAWFARHPESD